jgi:hypothetical protein
VAPEVTILLLRLGFLAVLYVFLGLLLIVLWRDLGQQRPAANRLPARLEVLEAGQSGTVGEMMLSPITTIGRAAPNAIALPDPSVSTEHALLAFRDGHWWLEDLGSTNGTLLNGARVTRPTIIRSGDTLTFGAVSLRAHL